MRVRVFARLEQLAIRQGGDHAEKQATGLERLLQGGLFSCPIYFEIDIETASMHVLSMFLNIWGCLQVPGGPGPGSYTIDKQSVNDRPVCSFLDR